MMELWMNNRKLWTEKINADLQRRADNHKQDIETLENAYKKELMNYKNCTMKLLKLMQTLFKKIETA